MASDNQDPMTSPQQPASGPGPVLRARREAGGHSLEDVCRDTRITRTKLAALEAEEYAKAGSDTFVMGYIRQYAKWLNMDGDELVHDYERVMGRERSEKQALSAESRPAPSSTRKGFPLIWLVVGVIVVWLTATWFLNGRQQHEPRPSEAPQATTETESPATQADTQPADGPDDMQEDSFAVGQDEPVDTAPAENASALADTPDDVVGTEETVGMDDEAAEETPANDAAPTPEPAATDELTMTFSDDCWVEVRNAAGEVLFAQLQHAGDNLHLSGQAPFNIMLGNARAATVFVNGRLVNSDPGPNRDTMRLRSVGP